MKNILITAIAVAMIWPQVYFFADAEITHFWASNTEKCAKNMRDNVRIVWGGEKYFLYSVYFLVNRLIDLV